MLRGERVLNRSAVEKHRRGKNGARQKAGEWATDIMLRAVAGVKQMQVVSVDADACTDLVRLLETGTSSKTCRWRSWSKHVVPALKKGDSIIVVVHNGVNHFDAAVRLV